MLLKTTPARRHTKNLHLVCELETPIDRTMFLIKDKPIQKALKRLIDIVLSSTALVVLSPLFILLIILIKIDSEGPAIFKQKRVGLNKKTFYMYKFRSMVEDADEKIHEVKDLNHTNPIMFKAKKDPRVTKIGSIIRKYSLDELPQLLNILKGEMTLVGPRPPIPRELAHYKNWHYVKFVAKPGLTGLWQVSGRSTIKDFDEVINLDYEYIKNWNILFDLKIILKTIPVVISAVGAG